MTCSNPQTLDPELDLLLEREVDVPPELVWEAWTKPEHIKKFFTPSPWETIECESDLRPGGIFRTVMRSPEGDEFPSAGCYLEVIPNEKLVWTSALGPGFRPLPPAALEGDSIPFTAIIELERSAIGTKYRAIAIHGDGEVTKRHEEMRFHEGWGAVLTQLVEYVKTW